MRRLLLQLLVSVDGYFGGPHQELDWRVVDDEFLTSAPWTMVGTASRDGYRYTARSSARSRRWMAV